MGDVRVWRRVEVWSSISSSSMLGGVGVVLVEGEGEGEVREGGSG